MEKVINWSKYKERKFNTAYELWQYYNRQKVFVKHLQQYLDRFTQGENGRQGNAVSNARVYMQVGGHLEEIKRIEVQESNIIGDMSIRVVLKPQKERLIIAPNTPE